MEFIEYNANPKHLKTGDCVIRAISFALNKDYIETIKNKYVAGTKIRLIKMYDKQAVPKWNNWCC